MDDDDINQNTSSATIDDDQSPNNNLANMVAFNEDIEEASEEPKVGMEFLSVGDAYKHYTAYAGKVGFDVRKQTSGKNTKGFLTSAKFVCSKEGFRKMDKRKENPSYQKPDTRVGCKAAMSCLLQKNGSYKIVHFNNNHNHELIRTPMKHLLKVNRSISDVHKSRAEETEMFGISIKSTMDLLSGEVGGREYVGFTNKDFRNYIHRKRMQAMEKGDAGAILEYFDKKRLDNSTYSSMQLDEDDMITNIFWADPRSVCDYGLFGDVVCFDTTYRTNEYGRPFAPFIGVNHHKQTIIFGAALLYDETIESFKWLFEKFLDAMSGKKPKTILTDQSAAMAMAISLVFGEETKHRLCVWHIYQNAAKHLSHVFNGSKQFVVDFSRCMYDYEDEKEWLSAWEKMLDEYDLHNNDWLKSQFNVKEKWALVYGRTTFTADMKSTQRSESMNNVLKNYLKPSHNLLRFLEHYERVLADRRYEELLADFKMMNTKPVMIYNTSMLHHGMEVYTPEVFKLFQDEYMKILNYDVVRVCKEGSTSTYNVCFRGTSKEHYVTYDPTTQEVCCSCSKFTHLGILCAHALKVLDKKNIKHIPDKYIKKRWSRNAKARDIGTCSYVENHDNPKESIGKRYGHLCRNFREIAICASEDDKLTKYTHECLVELLQNLEKMKATSFSHGTSVDGSEKGKELVTTVDSTTAKPIGVKRKATVGRPKGRFKDPLERKNSKSKNKAVKTTKKSLLFGQESNYGGVNIQEEQIVLVAPQIHALSQDYVNLDATTSDYMNLDETTSDQNHLSFTQLLQSSIARQHDLR